MDEKTRKNERDKLQKIAYRFNEIEEKSKISNYLQLRQKMENIDNLHKKLKSKESQYDIAIVELTFPIQDDVLPLREDRIPKGNHTAFGVSANSIYDNRTGNVVQESNTRHIAVINFKAKEKDYDLLTDLVA